MCQIEYAVYLRDGCFLWERSDFRTWSYGDQRDDFGARHRGEGFISAIQQNDPNHYALSANIPTAVGVRTGIFFGTSLYVGVPAAGLEPAQIWNYGVPE